MQQQTRTVLDDLSYDIITRGRVAIAQSEATGIGTGCGRIVAHHPTLPSDTVAKFSLPPDLQSDPLTRGYVQNEIEAFLTKTQNPLSAHLQPVEQSPRTHSRWGTMKYAAPIDESSDAFTEHKQTLSEIGITSSDYHVRENWGEISGNPRLIDYGYIRPDHHSDLVSTVQKMDLWKHHRSLYDKFYNND